MKIILIDVFALRQNKQHSGINCFEVAVYYTGNRLRRNFFIIGDLNKYLKCYFFYLK